MKRITVIFSSYGKLAELSFIVIAQINDCIFISLQINITNQAVYVF